MIDIRKCLRNHQISITFVTLSYTILHQKCRFYYAIWPLVQSLPELLHHQEEVVTMIESHVLKCQPATLSSFLQLISVLGRYIRIVYKENFRYSLHQKNASGRIFPNLFLDI